MNRRQAFSKNGAGFTLVEIVVVMAIVSIVTAMTIASFQSGRTQKELAVNARVFAAYVRKTQNYALTGKKINLNPLLLPCSSAYRVLWSGTVTPNATYITNYRTKDPITQACVAATAFDGPYTLKNGVLFDGLQNSFYFTLPYGEIATNASPWWLSLSTPNYFTIRLTKKGMYHVVCVYANGQVTDHPLFDCPATP